MAHIERSVLSIHMWVLEIKPVLTGLVANTLTQWAISLLVPILYLQRDEAISSEFQTGLTSTERTQQQTPKGNKHAPYGYTKHCINPHNFLPTVISVSKTTLTYLLSRGLFFVSTLQFAVIHKPPSQKAWRHWTHRAVRSVPSVLLLREQPLLVWATLAARTSLSCLGGDSCSFSLSLHFFPCYLTVISELSAYTMCYSQWTLLNARFNVQDTRRIAGPNSTQNCHMSFIVRDLLLPQSKKYPTVQIYISSAFF